MNRHDSSPDLNTDLLAWRRKALSILLWVIVGVRAVQFLKLWMDGSMASFPAVHRWAFAVLLALLLGVATFRELPHLLRGWFLLTLGYLNIVTGFALGVPLFGSIALVLLTIPIHASIFLGRRSGWVASSLSVSLFAGMALAAKYVPQLPADDPRLASSAWDDILRWLVVFLPVVFILDRFTALLQRLGSKERTMRLQLQAEAEERRYLEGALLETSERERQAVGHELHDGICQQITGAMLQCKVVERAMDLGGAPDSRQVRMISTMLDGSLGQVHDLARGLSPGTLSPEALVPSLRDLARRTRETFEVECEVEALDCPERLEPAAATHLYRIAQEAVINAVKHGQPRRILVRLSLQDGTLVLEVDNDGGRLSVPAQDREGMGLRIMRHRSELLGGIFELLAGTSPGLCVRCAVPLARIAFEAGP